MFVIRSITPFARFHVAELCPSQMPCRTSTFIRLASHLHNSRNVLKFNLSSQGAFFGHLWNSTILTLASSTLWKVVPSLWGGGIIGSAGEGGKAVLLTISTFSSKVVGEFPYESLSAGVVNDIHGMV